MNYRFILIVMVLVGLTGCASLQPQADEGESSALVRKGDQVIWNGEYAFTPPPPEWALYDLNEEDASLVFVKIGETFAAQTAISYAEEPFGYSRDLKERAEQYLTRYLWAARVNFDPPTFEETRWQGRPALWMQVVGHEPVKGQKVRGRLLFTYRGKRVIVFMMTQWKQEGESFNRDYDKVMQKFVDDFRFLKPSFYDRMGF